MQFSDPAPLFMTDAAFQRFMRLFLEDIQGEISRPRGDFEKP
jgi:hypothetical protein